MARHHHGFSLIELLVVVSIIAVLAALLLPAIGLVRDAANRMSCRSSLRQLAMGTYGYAQDWDGALLPLADAANNPWMTLVRPYVEDWTTSATLAGVIWGCPEYRRNPMRNPDGSLHAWFPGYALNGMPWQAGDPAAPEWNWHTKMSGIGGSTVNLRAASLSAVTQQAKRGLFADATDWWPAMGAGTLVLRHRQRACSVVFFDGHVGESTTIGDARRTITDPASRL